MLDRVKSLSGTYGSERVKHLRYDLGLICFVRNLARGLLASLALLNSFVELSMVQKPNPDRKVIITQLRKNGLTSPIENKSLLFNTATAVAEFKRKQENKLDQVQNRFTLH